MDPAKFSVQFQEAQLRRLHDLVELGEPIVTADLDAPSVRRRLRDVEVLVTSWGCPGADAERLADAPRAAGGVPRRGDVRTFVTGEVWRRGILMTSAADANAIPVAEFTLAAIIFAGKKVPFLAADARTAYRGLEPPAPAAASCPTAGARSASSGSPASGAGSSTCSRALDARMCLVADPTPTRPR